MTGFTDVPPEKYYQLVSQNPLAWIIPQSRPEDAILMPVLFEDEGCKSLFGHLPLRAPIVTAFQENTNATCLFLGPHQYISPEWAKNSDWVPTWNFISVKIFGAIELQADKTRSCVDRLVDHMQQDSSSDWSTERVEHRMVSLLAQIIGFSFHVEKISPRFKLGQDETPETYANIKNELEGHDLSKWMS